MFFRQCVQEMSGYVPGEQPPAGARVVKLNTNENPYPPSPLVAEAIRRELGEAGERLRLYSDPLATELREVAAARAGLAPSQVLVGNGSDEVLALLLRAIVEPGEAVAYPYPSYVLYETLGHAQGAVIRSVDYARDFALPDVLFGIDARLVFVTNPNSPSGTRIAVDRLAELAASLPRAVVVVDEAYIEFTDGTAVELIERFENVVVTRTLSKSHSLAGMRIGFLFGSTEMVAGLAKVKDSYNLDRLALAAGTAALRDETWTRSNVERIVKTRARLEVALGEKGFDVIPSHANFVFARARDRSAAQATYHDLKGRGILVRYFDRPLLDDGLRITVGTDDEIDALLDAL